MLVNKILKVVLLLLGGIFIILQGLAYEVEGAAISSLMLLLLTILYCVWTKRKSALFLWFLVAFSFAHVLSYIAYLSPEIRENQIDYFYYGANILFILSYMLLIIRILIRLNLKKVFQNLSIPILILVVLYVFCVIIVSETTENVLSISQNYLELVYNTVIMVLLSVALINYMYRNDNKSMLFLLASIFIVFFETIQLAYYYILLEDKNLGFMYSIFMVIALLFFYLQSQLTFTGPVAEYSDE